MEIRSIFIPILICTGIFGFTDAGGDFNSDLSSIVYSFSSAAGLPSEYAGATTDEYNNEIIDRFRKPCERSGEAGALTMARKIQNTKECILSLDESMKVEYSRITKDREGTPEDFINTLCPHLSELESCLNNFKKDNPCLGPTELEGFDGYRDSIMARQKLTCKHDGEYYKQMASESVKTCLAKRNSELDRCMKEIFGEPRMVNSSEVLSPSEPQKLRWRLLSKEGCAIHEKIHECSLNVLQQCSEPEVINAAKDSLNEILLGYRCKNSANSQSLPVSLIVLLILTVFMALRF